MAFSTQAIKYGWVALASLGVLTGATIYVVSNQRHQVKPQDIIEIVVGTHERCLATQYSTNPISYYVSPPSFVRTWYSNVYTTNGMTVYTNIVTNAIGWHIDRDMMVSLDTTIKALVPYYVDTNTVYDGTTNIVMLTVTGLWASLGIGDHTNQFTRTPCWTNPVSTNWIVNYTSYWPSTNGVATNIVYTSDYQQVVNYATSWTATGGHVWVTSSNWVSSVVTVTNAATYGNYPWQIYTQDLEERYKVLNALKRTKVNLFNYSKVTAASWYYGPAQSSWGAEKTYQEGHKTTNTYYSKQTFQCLTAGVGYDLDGGEIGYRSAVITSSRILGADIRGLNTNISYILSCWVYPTTLSDYPFGGGNNPAGYTNDPFNAYYPPPDSSFDDNGLGVIKNEWHLVELPFGLSSEAVPIWCDNPIGSYDGPPVYIWTGSPRVWVLSTSGSHVLFFGNVKGFEITEDHQIAYADWQFNYCTNKYW